MLISCPNDVMRDLVEIKVSSPVADSFIINSGAPTSSLSVILYSNVSKEEDALEMRFRNESGSWSDWTAYSSSAPWNLSIGDGTKTVYAEYRDEGHHVVSMENNIVLNTGAPAGDFYVWGSAISGNQHLYVNSSSVSLCMTISNVASMRFSNDGGTTWGSWVPYSDIFGWTITAGDGLRTIDAEFKTNAGTTTSSSCDIILDTTAPSVTDFLVNSGDESANNTGATVTYSYTEDNNVWAEYRNDSGSWSSKEPLSSSPVTKNWTLRAEAGTRTVYIRLSDIAGNVSSAYSDDIYLNTAAPAAPVVTAVTPTLSMYPTWSWESVSGAESYIYSFNNSTWSENISATEYTPGTALMGDMTHTLYVRAVDSEGRESESGSSSVFIDTTAPVISFTGFNDTVFRTGDTITITFSVTDVSGIGSINVDIAGYAATVTGSGSTYTASYTLTEALQSAQYAISITAGDSVGNGVIISPWETITIDNAAPVISSFTINNGNTYSCSPVVQVTIDVSDNFTSTDNLMMEIEGSSGAIFTPFTSPYNITASTGTVTVMIIDEAGNTTSASTGTITLKSGSTDIKLENQSLPSHLASSAFDLGNMSDYEETGGDTAFGSTYEAYGAQNLWDEDWYKIYIDGGNNPQFTVWGEGGANISGLIKFEVYYDQEGTQPAPPNASGYVDNGSNITVTINATDFWDPNQKTIWIKIFKDPAAADYTGTEYFLDWGIGYM